ncbi:Microtubule-associated tumor suppressor candidate 2 [Channa argus]|uniref:Microtubule-associated tumor suppressor candidate 2 n=1 Tax=Channa argus TaxID=215402 RepID=A0A6G1QVM7_CHAAH|nr:Microtubule-associated tumor suppressor candidate 2 [Channa argus]
MSIPTSLQGVRVSVDREDKIGNKNQFPKSGDDNANRQSSIGNQDGRALIEDIGYSTNSIPPLVSQSESPDRLVIWGSEQQCLEPEVRKFGLVECQEIHTFIGNTDQEAGNEQEDDGGSIRDGKDEGPMSISSSSTASSASIGVRKNDNDSNKMESRIQRGEEVQKTVVCHSTEELDTCVTGSIEKGDRGSGRERRKAGLKESKSETNVFVSSLSAVAFSGSLSSALDSSGEAQSFISLAISKSNANNTTSADTRRRAVPVDANHNSPPLHPAEKHGSPQYCGQHQGQEEGSHYRNGLSSDGGLGQRRRAGFEERVLPPRRQQLVRPLCQTEMGKASGLPESSAHRVKTGESTSPKSSPDPHNNGSNRRFTTKYSLREPSNFSHLYNTSAVSIQVNQQAQKEVAAVEKQPSATVPHSSSPSNPSTLEKRPQTQLTYRRNCSSPNRTGVDSRSSTPPNSPLRTPQGSPRKQPSMYLVSRNVPGVVRHITSGCNPALTTSAQGYGNSCLRAQVKTLISTSGIPKVHLNSQQSSPHSSPKQSSPSPTLKPKGVRPKIITYVRKNPSFKPQAADGPYQMGRAAGFKASPPEDLLQPQTAAQAGGSGSLLRSGRGLRLGLGAVTRTTRGLSKDDQVFTHSTPAPATAAAQPQATASRSLLPKANQSGLRPPGFSSSRLPAGRLAAFGFVRSSSVSSVSSAHSAESTQSDPCRTAHRLSVSEDPPLHRVTTSPPTADHQRGAPCRSSSLQPPFTPALPRRYLPPQPRSSPGVQSGQRPTAAVEGSAPLGFARRVAPLRQEQQESLQREKEEAQQKEREIKAEEKQKEEQREEVHRLQGRCEQQERQLRALREELRRTSLGLEAFIITTQHYCLKLNQSQQYKTDCTLCTASNSVRWDRLQREKTALELTFERELQELQLQQEAELAAVEQGLRKCHSAETEHLKVDHRSEMEELRTQQQEQIEEMTVSHQAAIQDLRDMHNITMATLHEEHARTMRDLRKAHEQQKVLLEEDFEKLRLSLQDQVDTLTFQNQSLRDKAKRFEEALRRSTDEQIVDALAPYQHIEQDLKSLKEVVEMKNQQIHQQERKISDLEKVAQKNMFLEEKVHVLQQQNEDLKARIEMNLASSRQLSEENANLQESVEKESTEKKRLSRNNEELLWRLQTSPLMSPASSPLHRSFSTSPVPSSPFFSSSPGAGCDSPTHCHGCSQQASYSSPSHRATTNQNLSPGPATPTHRAATNQNYSPGPDTPTHRASANRCSSTAFFSSLQR